ncbi:type II secretion system F family protein [Methanothermococcus sp. SCGC AD-155-C09]|nr:type II secretion system F family protein [Methanothermococcus sp. SCGC AD-155-C09]
MANSISEKFMDIIYDLYSKITGKRIRRSRKRRRRITNIIEIKESLSKGNIDQEALSEFYESYDEGRVDMDIDLDKILEQSPQMKEFVNTYIRDITYNIIHTKIFPSKADFQYVGIDDINKYILRVILISSGIAILFILNSLFDGDIFTGLINGLLAGGVIFIGGVFYPKIKMILFRGEIKIQIIITILNMISSLNSGMSLQETIKNIAENPEYGIPSYEFRNIFYDVNRGGYTFKEALERAKKRTKVPLMEKLYDQLILSSDKGGTQLLLKNLYEEIIRESVSKIDSSKFQISNLGNLLFGTGMILPFSGMMLSSIQGGGGFDGIINTVNMLLTKMAPMLTAIFAIFIKMKIE